jgi:hypothetical protein
MKVNFAKIKFMERALLNISLVKNIMDTGSMVKRKAEEHMLTRKKMFMLDSLQGAKNMAKDNSI